MTQDQNAQVTNTNNNITEQVSEQEVSEEKLQDITGGCFSCGILSGTAAIEASSSLNKAQRANDAGAFNQATKEIGKAAAFATISNNAAKHTTPYIEPCANCFKSIVGILVTKKM